jgi:GDSL-like lipase/acylhydrolase family protein
VDRRRFATLALLAPLAQALLAQEGATRRAGFGYEIERFLDEDRRNPPPQGAILFIGSSIFREWADLERQMAPLPVFNRAFGGSRTWEVLYYADKIVLPYKPRIIVYYCGSNDVGSGAGAAEVAANFGAFVEKVAARLPGTRVFFVSINKAPEKQHLWKVVDEANSRVRDYTKGNPRLGFIDVNPALFDKAGKPRLELYQEDQLHLRPAAYAEFTRLIRPVVEKAWAAAGGRRSAR